MTGVIRGEHESLESALRRFKRKVQAAGIMAEVRRRTYYSSEADRRRKRVRRSRPGRGRLVLVAGVVKPAFPRRGRIVG